jgi:uncharacterized protein
MDVLAEMGPYALVLLGAAAFVAGLVDAVVGGGGLVQIPALFSILQNVSSATLLGTSKLAGVFGTSVAAIRYAKTVKQEWATALPGAAAAFIFSFLGAVTVTLIPPDLIRKILPFVLIAVALYTFLKKDFGTLHTPTKSGRKEVLLALFVGAGIGFYDGFFGPGTGSLLIFLFVRFFGFDFLRASAAAKVVNVACNLAALLWFGWSGHLIVALGLGMALLNVMGALCGSWLAIKHGSVFVRRLFLVVIGPLILKTGYDAFAR